MPFNISQDITGIMAFLEGLLSFFSPCVLPLLPVYLSFLAGGTASKDEEGNVIYKRSTVAFNTFFFVLGIASTFFILSLGVTGLGLFFSHNRKLLSIIGGVIVIIFGLWQLFFYGTKYGSNKEARIHIKRKGSGPFMSFLLGFTFSFSWTPCIGPILASILIVAASSSSGIYLLLLYALGFIIPFVLLGLFASAFTSFFKKHMNIVKYTVRIGAILMIALGLLMIFGNLDTNNSQDTELEMKDLAIDFIENETSIELESEKVEEPTTSEETTSISEEDILEENESIEVVANDSEETPNENADEEVIEECDLDHFNYSFLDQYGKVHKLSSYKGKTVFINFWATWCGPCKSEMPEIETLYNKYKDSDVVILSVAFPNIGREGSGESIKEFMKENGYTYPVLLDSKGVLSSELGISAFPTTIMVGASGNFYGYLTGAMTLETMESIISQTINGDRDKYNIE